MGTTATIFLFTLVGLWIIGFVTMIIRFKSKVVKETTPRVYLNPTEFFFGTVDNVITGNQLEIMQGDKVLYSDIEGENVDIYINKDKPSGINYIKITCYNSPDLNESGFDYDAPFILRYASNGYEGLLITDIYNSSDKDKIYCSVDRFNQFKIDFTQYTKEDVLKQLKFEAIENLRKAAAGLTKEEIKEALKLN